MGHVVRGSGPLAWGSPVRGFEVASALTHSWRASPSAWEPSRARLAEVQPLLTDARKDYGDALFKLIR